MIIGVIAVAVMQPPVVDIIHVRAVLHHGVLLTRMAVGMGIAGDTGDKLFIRRIGRCHFECMFIDMAVVAGVKVPVMQVIDMPAMIERGVAASTTVGMAGMVGMDHVMRAKRRCKQGKAAGGCEESLHG